MRRELRRSAEERCASVREMAVSMEDHFLVAVLSGKKKVVWEYCPGTTSLRDTGDSAGPADDSTGRCSCRGKESCSSLMPGTHPSVTPTVPHTCGKVPWSETTASIQDSSSQV